MWSTGYSACWPCGSASTAPATSAPRQGAWVWWGSGNEEFRAVGRLDTLLGPEGTGVMPGCLWIAGPAPHPSSRVFGVGGPGCFLRTAQWTRASLVRLDSAENFLSHVV